MDEIEFITIQISAQTYAGFQYKIPKDIINSMTTDEIIKETKDYMKKFFKDHNLYLLEQGVNNMGELHFHDDIPFNRNIIYLCDHCHGNE
jgi:hypothetical protein